MTTPSSSTPRAIRVVAPPPGVKLPPDSVMADDGNVYDRTGRLLGRVAIPSKQPPSTPAAAAANRASVAVPVTPNNSLPPGVNPLPSPKGVTLPPGAQLGSDGHVYAGGKIIGKIATAPPSPSLSSLASPVAPRSSVVPSSPSASSLPIPVTPSASASASSSLAVPPATPGHVRNSSSGDAIHLHMRTPSALSAVASGAITPSHGRTPSASSSSSVPNPAAPITPTSAASTTSGDARVPSTPVNSGNGRLPDGVTPASVPAGLKLPTNSTLGSDGNVYDSSGKVLGKVALAAPTPSANRLSAPNAGAAATGTSTPTSAAGHGRQGSGSGSGHHSRGNSIWNQGAKAFPPGDIRPIEPPAGVKIPAGAMLNHDGRVFSNEGKLLGHVKMPGQSTGSGTHGNDKKTVQAIAPPPGVKLPPGCILTSTGDVFDAKSGKLMGHVKLPKIAVPPPPGVTLPAGAICTADGNVYDATGTKLLGHVKMPDNAKTPKSLVKGALPAHTTVGPDGVTVFDTTTGKVVGTVQKKPKELRVVDGRKFGLKEGMFVGPGGMVYSGKGKQLGHMKGWDERRFKKYLPAAHEEPVRLQDAQFEGKDVLVRGQVVGTLGDDGSVTDHLGKVIGRVSLDTINQVNAAIERESKLPSATDQIAELLNIPNYHQADDNIDMTTDKLESLGAKEEKFVKIEVREDKENNDIGEPTEGIHPEGFAIDHYDRTRAALPCSIVVPSRFTRAYLPRDFPIEEKLVSPDTFNRICQGKIRATPFKLIWVGHLHQVLSSSHLRNLGKLVSSMKSLVVLGLPNCNISSLELHLPNLLRLDVSGNRLKGNKQIVSLVSGTPLLQQLNLLGNPCVNGWRNNNMLPPTANDIWKTLLLLKDFEALNGKAISNAVRAAAYARHENKKLRAVVPAAIWNHAINYVPQIATMARWEPQLITTLNLSGQALSAAHIAVVAPSLISLSLANNQFKTLKGWGLEQCDRLQILDVSGNQLEGPREFKVLVNIPSLLDINLYGNPGLIDYRAEVIYTTRGLKGTNRSPGLQRLDNKPITIEERLAAFIRIGGGRGEEHERWRLLQIQAYGHTQLRHHRSYIGRIHRMEFPAANLSWVDVGAFKGLNILDLSNNNIENVNGLQQIEGLRVLLLHGNKRLQTNQVYRMLHATKTLEHVSFWSQAGKPTMSHLRSVLSALPDNPKLAVIDGMTIPISERVRVQRELYQLSAAELHQYHVDLALTIACTPFEGRSYRAAALKPGVQYRPERITDLSNLCNMELPSDGLDLSIFINVEKIDLSANELTDICSIGLAGLKKLKYLDVRRNKIKNSLQDIGELLNSILSLQLFAIARNPIMKDVGDRERLIGHIDRMHEVECALRVIDTPITIDERVAAWKRIGGNERASEQLRYKAALGLKAPKPDVIAPFMLLALDLDGMNLVSAVDLTLFPNLQRLRLSNNRLETLKGTGISRAAHLRVLDLRNNRLSDMKEMVVLCNKYLHKLEYLGLRGNVYSTDQYYAVFRRKLVGAIKSLRQLRTPLRYLDDEVIHGAEIVNGWIAAEPTQKTEAEAIRFNLCLDRKLNGRDAASVYALDLSNCDLATANFSAFVRLRRLNLNGNKFNTKQLEAAGLPDLVHLSELQLNNNNITSSDEFGEFVGKCRGIRVLGIAGNPITSSGIADRLRVLAAITIIGEPRLPLREVDGKAVTTEERVAAIRSTEATGNQGQSEYVRTILTLEELKYHHAVTTKVDVTDRALVNLNPLRFYNQLEHLVLCGNKLVALDGQGLQYPSKLHTLDIRNNKIATLDSVLLGCSEMDNLQHLWLTNSTADGRTAKLGEDLLRHVSEHLRGLVTLDGHPCPSEFRLNGTQHEALLYLQLIAEVGINHLKDVDISNLGLSSEHFFSILAALVELRCVRTLRATGNGWNEGSRRIANYRQFVIYAMGENLAALDGERIHDAERLLSIRTITQNKEDMARVQKWVAVKERAMRKVKEKPLADEKKKKRAAPDTGPNWMDWKSANASPAAAEAAEKKAAIIAAAGNKASLAVAGAGEVLQRVSGTILNKFEIIVNFIQIYGLVLVLDLKVPWPDLWLQLSQWVKFFTLDIDIYFDITIPYKQVIKFAAVMALPFISVLLFIVLGLVGKRRLQWIESYIDHWSKTRVRVGALVIFGLGLSFLGGLLADWNTSVALLKAHTWPSGRSNGIFVIFGTVVLSLSFIWYLVVRSFRRRYLTDTTPEKRHFFEWWLDNILWWRKIALFLTTIIFMPVARVILEQFHCMCPLDESDDVRADVLARSPYNSTLPDYSCQIYPFTDPLQPCFPDEVSGNQIAGMIFGLAYIIGIPIFYYRLIRDGVHQMIDIQGYTALAQSTETQVAALKVERSKVKGSAGKKAIDGKIAKLEKDLTEFYFNKATSPLAKLPQTYLYAAYERKWRFWKLFQMFQKLLIIICTMFIPRAAFSSFRIMCGNFVVVAFAGFSIITRPFSDRFEDYMEILSQLANSTNILIALGLTSSSLSQAAADTILIIMNGLAVCMFALSIIASPFQYCRNVISYRTAKEAAQRQAAVLARVASLDSPALSVANLHAVGDAAVAVKQESVEMASRVITLASDVDSATIRAGASYVVDNRSAIAHGAYNGAASAAAYVADNHGAWASVAANGMHDAAAAGVAIIPDQQRAAIVSAAQSVGNAGVNAAAAIGIDGDDIKRGAVEVKDVGIEMKDAIVAGAQGVADVAESIPIPAAVPSADEIKAAAEQSEAAAIAALSFVADSDAVQDSKDAIHDAAAAIGAQSMMIIDDGKQIGGSAANAFVAIAASDSFNDFSEEAANEFAHLRDVASSAVNQAGVAISGMVHESKDMISSGASSAATANNNTGASSSASSALSSVANNIQSGMQSASDAFHSAGVALQSVSRDDILQFNANLGGNINSVASDAVHIASVGITDAQAALPGATAAVVSAYDASANAISSGVNAITAIDVRPAAGNAQQSVSRLDEAQSIVVNGARTGAQAAIDASRYVYDHRQQIGDGITSGVRTAANISGDVAHGVARTAADGIHAAQQVNLGTTGNAIVSGVVTGANTVATTVGDHIHMDDIKRVGAAGVSAIHTIGTSGVNAVGDVNWQGAGSVAIGAASRVGDGITSVASHVNVSDIRDSTATAITSVGNLGHDGITAIGDHVDISGARTAISSGITSVGNEAKSAVEYVREHKQEVLIGGAVITGGGAAFAVGGVAGVAVAGAAVLGSGVLGVGFDDIPGMSAALSSGHDVITRVVDGTNMIGNGVSNAAGVVATNAATIVSGVTHVASDVARMAPPLPSTPIPSLPSSLPSSVPLPSANDMRVAAHVASQVGTTVGHGAAQVITSDNARTVANTAAATGVAAATYVYDHRDDIGAAGMTIGRTGANVAASSANYVYDHRNDIGHAGVSIGHAAANTAAATGTYVYDHRTDIASGLRTVGNDIGTAAMDGTRDGATYIYDQRGAIGDGLRDGGIAMGNTARDGITSAATSAYDHRGAIGDGIISGMSVAGNEVKLAASSATTSISNMVSSSNTPSTNTTGMSGQLHSGMNMIGSNVATAATSLYDNSSSIGQGVATAATSGGTAAIDASRQMIAARQTNVVTTANDVATLANAAKQTISQQASQVTVDNITSGGMVAAGMVGDAAINVGINADSVVNNRDNLMSAGNVASQQRQKAVLEAKMADADRDREAGRWQQQQQQEQPKR